MAVCEENMQSKVRLCESALAEAKKTIKNNRRLNKEQSSQIEELNTWKIKLQLEMSDVKSQITDLSQKMDKLMKAMPSPNTNLSDSHHSRQSSIAQHTDHFPEFTVKPSKKTFLSVPTASEGEEPTPYFRVERDARKQD